MIRPGSRTLDGCRHPAPPRVAPTRRANRDAVLRTRRHSCSRRKGSTSPSTRSARAAGVSRATIYRHFPTREDLLVGIFEQSIEEVEELAARQKPGPDAFLALFKATMRKQVESVPLTDLLPRRAALPPGLRALREQIHGVFAEPLRTAQEAGVVRVDHDCRGRPCAAADADRLRPPRDAARTRSNAPGASRWSRWASPTTAAEAGVERCCSSRSKIITPRPLMRPARKVVVGPLQLGERVEDGVEREQVAGGDLDDVGQFLERAAGMGREFDAGRAAAEAERDRAAAGADERDAAERGA